MSCEGKKRTLANGMKIYDYEKKMDPMGLAAHNPGQYACVLPSYSKIFSEIARPIKAKFYIKHLYEMGINMYIINPGHMTKMATLPIYGKSQEPFSYDIR